MDLQDTIEMMNSNDYKEWFKAEYYQLKIRASKLSSMLTKYENGVLEFKPSTPVVILKEQLSVMEEYKAILENRAVIENIELRV